MRRWGSPWCRGHAALRSLLGGAVIVSGLSLLASRRYLRSVFRGKARHSAQGRIRVQSSSSFAGEGPRSMARRGVVDGAVMVGSVGVGRGGPQKALGDAQGFWQGVGGRLALIVACGVSGEALGLYDTGTYPGIVPAPRLSVGGVVQGQPSR